ncbi:LysE/ArgO family amino acid transporter [Acinetobacter sp. c3-l95]|uniref:LysE/ArgO family amino acid transporter n=1 Tax=Acinetobacter sp. c3-l95 TaxID=3342804 RepID=UPI0035BAD63B
MMLGLSLIVAIGAQNAFVLKQGILKQHVFWICLFCACSDAVLIGLGVFGFAPLLAKFPTFIILMKYFGVLFLFAYGLLAFKRAYDGGQHLQLEQDGECQSLKQAIALCFAFTWLNPHVYLDTVVLMGSVSSHYQNKIAFASGAMLASFLFFFSLGYLARFLRPLFTKANAWRVLDSVIGIMMWWIAFSLLRS